MIEVAADADPREARGREPREVVPIPKTYREAKPTKPLDRKSRIRPVSKRRASENRERRANLVARFGQFPPCYACPVLDAAGISTGCAGRAADGHELLTRGRGGSIVDVENVIPVGRLCHDWITTHPREAAELGLVRTASRSTVSETEEDE